MAAGSPGSGASSLILFWMRTALVARRFITKPANKIPVSGPQPVYRMVNTLEEIGVISRKNMYKFTGNADDEEMECVPYCRMELDDGTVLQLSDRKFRQVLTCGLESCGYMTGKRIVKYTNNPGQAS